MSDVMVSSLLLIDGQLTAAEDAATYENFSPVTEEVIGTAADASLRDLDKAIKAARKCFDHTDWSINHEFRKKCLTQFRDGLYDLKEEFYAVASQEVGAPMGTIIGGFSMAGGLGMATGPVLGGWIFDTTGDYGWLFISCFGMGIGAVLIAAMFRPFPNGNMKTLQTAEQS